MSARFSGRLLSARAFMLGEPETPPLYSAKFSNAFFYHPRARCGIFAIGMRIQIICPAPRGSRSGNRTTAVRWARLLRQSGHRVGIAERYHEQPCDVLIAMHARRSADAARRFHARYPGRPLIVALTGTDLYRDIRHSRAAQRSLELATRLIVLQPLGRRELPRRFRRKTRVIYQSAVALRHRPGRVQFDVCVIGHLRAVKDPLRVALAARRLPDASRIRVRHLGQALTAGLARRARGETRRNPRYHWLGNQPHRAVRSILARSHLLVLPSRLEGGANVISEAVAAAVPVVGSRIRGTCGLLGSRYPGLFPVGDTPALARLLWRAETDPRFYTRLARTCAARAHLFRPQRERRAWQRLLRGISNR
jgi:putative glycosyltransferase (TIGR04348 family)